MLISPVYPNEFYGMVEQEYLEVWESLDDLMLNIWPAIDRLFTELSKHERELASWCVLVVGHFSILWPTPTQGGRSTISRRN